MLRCRRAQTSRMPLYAAALRATTPWHSLYSGPRTGILGSAFLPVSLPYYCGDVRVPKRWTVKPHMSSYTLRNGIFRPSYTLVYVARRHPDPWLSSLPYTNIRGPMLVKNWSGWRDSNSRPTAPKAVALPGCATPRLLPHGKARNNTPIKNVLQLNNYDKFDRQAQKTPDFRLAANEYHRCHPR